MLQLCHSDKFIKIKTIMNEISVTLLCSDNFDFKIRFKIIRNITNIFIYSPCKKIKYSIIINWLNILYNYFFILSIILFYIFV